MPKPARVVAGAHEPTAVVAAARKPAAVVVDCANEPAGGASKGKPVAVYGGNKPISVLVVGRMAF